MAPAALVRARGGGYAHALGIDVHAGSAERFKWLLAALLYGARISEAIASRTWHVFADHGVLTPQRLQQTGWQGLVDLLDAGGYARYDFKTATKLLAAGEALLHDYAGDVDRVHAAAADPVDLETRLKALAKGVGDTTVGIFLRELRGVWPKAQPPLSEPALNAAIALGYFGPGIHDQAQALAALRRAWRRSGQPAERFGEFESALVREGLRRRRAEVARARAERGGGRR